MISPLLGELDDVMLSKIGVDGKQFAFQMPDINKAGVIFDEGNIVKPITEFNGQRVKTYTTRIENWDIARGIVLDALRKK